MHPRRLPRKGRDAGICLKFTMSAELGSYMICREKQGHTLKSLLLIPVSETTLTAAKMIVTFVLNATMTGAVIALTALIPVAGAYIGGAIGALMIFTVSPIKAIIFIVFLVILQQFEGDIIYPRVVGSSIGLPGIWVLAAVTIGGGVMGIAGMLLGVPLAATIYRLLSEDVNRIPYGHSNDETVSVSVIE